MFCIFDNGTDILVTFVNGWSFTASRYELDGGIGDGLRFHSYVDATGGGDDDAQNDYKAAVPEPVRRAAFDAALAAWDWCS